MVVVGSVLRCVNAKPFPGKKVGPPLTHNTEYKVRAILQEEDGDKNYYHYDVGFNSEYNYITSQDTGKELLDGDKIHWCHPSRFEEV